MDSIQPTWWDFEKVVQSNPVSCVDYGLFIGDTTHLVEMSYINKSGILGLETYLVEKLRSSSYPFLGKWFMVGTIVPIFYLFIFSLVFLCLFVVVLFLFFDDQDDLCS